MAKKQDTHNYNLKVGNKIVYKGTTNDIEGRAQDHRADGKRFDNIEKIGRAKTKENASKEEARQLKRYRENHKGNNPKYNKTDNG